MKRYLLACIFGLFCSGVFLALTGADDKKATERTPASPSKASPNNPTPNNATKDAKDTKTSAAKAESKVAQKQTLGFFHTIYLYGVGNLYITQSDELDFTIEAEPRIQELITAYVQDQSLYIQMKNASDYSQAKVNYYLKIKTLQAITSYAANSIYIKDGFETKVLSISMLAGFGEARLNVDVTKLTAKIIGAAKIEAEGIADELEVAINGVGEFTGNKLKSKLARVGISSSGIAKVNVSEDLIVKVGGNGSVQYCGKPNITKEVVGKGSISALDVSVCN